MVPTVPRKAKQALFLASNLCFPTDEAMLHRLALRVLPSLTLPVTEDSVRKRKRLVMFVPGLVAFACYRAAKQGFRWRSR